MASSSSAGFRKQSNPPFTSAKTEKELAYLYASNANVSNFVSVRLSGDLNYHLWKTQMLCLLDAHGMRGLVDDDGPTFSRRNTGEEYDILLRGWIFGSLSEDVLRIVVHHHSAESVWEKLERCFGSCKTSDQQDLAPAIANTTEDKNVLLPEKTAMDKGKKPAESEEEVYIQIKTEGIGTSEDKGKNSIESKAKGNVAPPNEMKDLAEKMINLKPEYAMSNNEVLLAIARTFPSGLDHTETLFYPSLDNMCKRMLKRTKMLFLMIKHTPSYLKDFMKLPYVRCQINMCGYLWQCICMLLILVPGVTIWVFYLILLILFMVYFPFFMLYYLLWKLAALIAPAIKNIEQKKKEYEEAKKVLDLVCGKINPSSREFYTTPILEAACQDAYDVVDQILGLWPDAIMCKDENGYDIIQLATIHRSNKTYNLIYNFREGTNVYGTMEDSSENNMLHLAAKLAPLNKLKRHTGAALQLQSELQWHQEVKKFVYPTYVTKKNIFEDTPEMVFTREHENLVKEGEKWIKAVAESCSITAALITTIVFAAAITVPGGSSQKGVPVFTNETAFAVFAFSDAISLFSSVTALLVFLSILTARFAEQDFLVRLPRRLIIGLCTLLISTSAMIVAFGATLFLVFSHHKLWMLTPICGLAILPIAVFIILQFPLILDLFRSTYISRFGKNNHHNSKCNPNEIRAFFDRGKSNHSRLPSKRGLVSCIPTQPKKFYQNIVSLPKKFLFGQGSPNQTTVSSPSVAMTSAMSSFEPSLRSTESHGASVEMSKQSPSIGRGN